MCKYTKTITSGSMHLFFERLIKSMIVKWPGRITLVLGLKKKPTIKLINKHFLAKMFVWFRGHILVVIL